MEHSQRTWGALVAVAIVVLVGYYAIARYRAAPPVVPNTGQVPIDITIEGAGKDVQ